LYLSVCFNFDYAFHPYPTAKLAFGPIKCTQRVSTVKENTMLYLLWSHFIANYFHVKNTLIKS